MIFLRSSRAFFNTEKSIPLWLFGLCTLAFGLLTPWLGFYWDDWPLAWFTHVLGPEGFIGFAPQRPFSGVLYYLSSALLGTRPIAWQIYALVWRWVAATLFWLLLRGLWPERRRMAVSGAVLFALYPGFSQQSIALIYSLYFIYYSFFLASLVVMERALRSKENYWQLMILAALLSAAAMLSTEYFYGLELLRPILVFIVVLGQKTNWRERVSTSVRHWLPFALLLVMVFAWRFNVSSEVSYDIRVFRDFAANPAESAAYYTTTILRDVYEATVLAWGQVLHLADLSDFGTRTFVMYGVGMLAGLLTVAWLVLKARTDHPEAGTSGNNLFQPLLLSFPALLLGGLSFWITDLPLRLGYPWDRGFLPMAFGSAMLLAWLLTSLLRWLKLPMLLQVGLIAVIAGLSIGFHFETGTGYLRAWRLQRDLYQQLYWRVPDLARDTIVLSPELKDLRFYTDNSLTGQLNWMYAPDYDPEVDSFKMPFFFNFVGEGWGLKLPEFETNQDFELDYRFFTFDGNTSRSIVLHYEPGQCLRILEPTYDWAFPKLPEELAAPLSVSSPSGVILPSGEADWPAIQFGAEAPHDWCYAYQKADLARQVEDWEAVVGIGFETLDNYEATHGAELVPFILGYAHTGDLERAEELTLQAYDFKSDERMQPMLCAVWDNLAESIGISEAQDMLNQLQCRP